MKDSWSRYDERLTNIEAWQSATEDRLAIIEQKLNNVLAINLNGISNHLRGVAFDRQVALRLNKVLSLNLTAEDFDTSHPLPNSKYPGTSRIIIKFVRRRVRNMVLSASKKLNHPSFYIT